MPENIEKATLANERVIEAFRHPEQVMPDAVLNIVSDYDGTHRVFAHIRQNAAKYFFYRATKVEQDENVKQKYLRQARELISAAILKYKYNPEEFKNHRAAAHFWESKILWKQGEKVLAREAIKESLALWVVLNEEDSAKWGEHYGKTRTWAKEIGAKI